MKKTALTAILLAIGLISIPAVGPSLAQDKGKGKGKGHAAPAARAPNAQPGRTFQRPTAVPSFRPTAPQSKGRPAQPRYTPHTGAVPSVRPNSPVYRNYRPSGSMLNPGVRNRPSTAGVPRQPAQRGNTGVVPRTPGRGVTPTTPFTNRQPTTSFRSNVHPGTTIRTPSQTRQWLNVPLDRNWPHDRNRTADNRWQQWRHSGDYRTYLHSRGDVVRNWYRQQYPVHRYNWFTPDWYRRYHTGYFWHYRVPTPWYWWRVTTVPSLLNWLSWTSVNPVYYYYGNNVVYSDGMVYYDQQPLATLDSYYDSALALAESGAQALAPLVGVEIAPAPNLEWMPLGVFALTNDQETEPTIFVQLAVTKTGLIGGTYQNIATNEVHQVSGAVDAQSQRVAWILDNNPEVVMEAGLFNLTQDQAPVLIHWGRDLTQTWLLTRVPPPQQ